MVFYIPMVFFYICLMYFYGDIMGLNGIKWDIMGYNGMIMRLGTLWLCQNSYGKSPFFMGKFTIKNGDFPVRYVTNYQRVHRWVTSYQKPPKYDSLSVFFT